MSKALGFGRRACASVAQAEPPLKDTSPDRGRDELNTETESAPCAEIGGCRNQPGCCGED